MSEQGSTIRNPQSAIRNNFRAWLQLLRVPNLFTVPGDPLAGFALAVAAVGLGLQYHAFSAVMAMAAAMCAYCAGLIHNDLSDFDEDLQQRPTRPLPSGRISRNAAIIVFILLVIAGLACAHLSGPAKQFSGRHPVRFIYGLLVIAIIVYNKWLKRVPVAGPLNMGICRGLSLLMGAAALGWNWQGFLLPPVLISAAGLTLYIAAVTAIAAKETSASRIGPQRWLPAAIVVAWLAIIYWQIALPFLDYCPPPAPGKVGIVDVGYLSCFAPIGVSILGALIAVTQSARFATKLSGAPQPAVVQKAIGMAIRCLLPIQAAIVAINDYPAIILAAILLIAWPLAALAGRKFHGS